MVDKHFFRHGRMGAWQENSFCQRSSLLKNMVCCFGGLFLVLCLFWANTSFAAVESQISVTWDYAGDTTDLAGFRLYQDGGVTPVCEVVSPAARDMLCTVTFSDAAAQFTMTAIDVYGVESDLSASVSVDTPLLITNQAPIAVASVNVAEGVAPLVVSFDGSGSSDADGAIGGYSWDFGDGSSELGMLVGHTYASPGLYTATLTVTDDSGATMQDVVAIAVSDAAALPFNEPPVASILPSTTEGLAPLYVSFDASASGDTDGSIVDYSWDFGDGATGAGRVAHHSFEIAGLYTVTLVVIDDQGATAQAQTVISVSKATGNNKPPKADFNVNKAQGRTKIKAEVMALAEAELVTATFDGSLSSDEDGTVVEYLWNFGDGQTADGMSVEHTYAEVGDYTVALSVMDDQGATTQVEKVVSLSDDSQETSAPVSPFVADEGAGGCSLVAGLDDPGRVGAWVLVMGFLAWLGVRPRLMGVKKSK